MTEERRRFTRLHFDQDAQLTLNDVIYQVKNLVDISIGGCKLEISGPFERGSRITLTLPLYSTTPDLEIIGAIERSDEKFTSIRFTEITPENLTHLHNMVRLHAEDADVIDAEIQSHPGLY
jgi:hypothetical protein